MIKLADTISISSSPAEVFAYISNLDNLPEWDHEIKKFQLVTPGSAKVGSRFIEETKIGSINCEVTEFAKDKALTFSGTSSAMDFTERILIEPWENGVRVTLTGTVEPKGFWKLLQPILSGEFRNGAKKELAALKKNLEKI